MTSTSTARLHRLSHSSTSSRASASSAARLSSRISSSGSWSRPRATQTRLDSPSERRYPASPTPFAEAGRQPVKERLKPDPAAQALRRGEVIRRRRPAAAEQEIEGQR